MRGRRRLVVICVDGGLPTIVREHDFFDLGRVLPGLPGSGVHELRSIYPSSTAPSHASFLTGTHPRGHGIVGNRFWEREAVADIRRRADDPLASFHPYEASSLTAPGLLDWFARQGATAAAVHFPQTFSRTARQAFPACYCLYAPARDLSVPLAPPADGVAVGRVTLSYLGHGIALCLRLDERTGTITVRSVLAGDGGTRAAIGIGNDSRPGITVDGSRPTRLDIPVPSGSVSVALTCRRVTAGRIEVGLGTAVLTLGFGGIDLSTRSGQGPASLHVDYTANPHHAFHESPRAEWVEQAALDVLEQHDPDVLFVRFNQADHAQEFLYWHAVRGGADERMRAWQQILDVYARIDACVTRLAGAVGGSADFLLFSDHGIDYVETHLRPNHLLGDLGLADRMVFQGDSNSAYLYADSPLAPAERAGLDRALRALDPSVRVLTPSDQEQLKLPVGSARLGRLTVSCGPHIEFQYDDATPTERVASASHGYLPSDPAMSGFYRHFGPAAPLVPPPEDITGAAAVVRRIWRHATRGA
ncbi:alkaline phosphatase family protein [Streptomyces sp. NBC_00083]|uniref:alkaline phosphatase family protein n=1 Tax=Streptomyces sp. NBC_00083 TaxID=2975647 RepID=UPI00224E7370|nr:alkaline phosphatase family protein [Streptomyces sp. NBC_00083]MCX5387340.1 alkaline phosphatase family protein [Streptomyces sp. NBC_00083]